MKNKDLSTADLIDFIKKNKKELYEKYHIVKIGIFGSFSKNQQDVNSDIDLLIEFDDNTQNIYEIKNDLRILFKRLFDRDIDIAREKYLKPRIKNDILKDVLYA